MSSEALVILDQSLRWTLLSFLGAFLFFGCYSWSRLRRRRKGLEDLLEPIEPADGEAERDSGEPPSADLRPANRLRPFFHSFLLSGAVSVLVFAVSAFAPLPFLHNFATEDSWRQTPLRVTAIDYDRFFEGFSLEGEIWNQSEETVQDITAAIEILDLERQPLDELSAPVRPERLLPATSGKFEFRYTENSPLIYGYRLRFRDADGNLIPHVEGFEVR